MNTTNKGEQQEDKIHTLSELIIDNDEEGRDEVEELIHPDFIKAMEALAELQKEGELSRGKMEEVNELYKKHKEIQEEGEEINA